jgi:hypothetical protein
MSKLWIYNKFNVKWKTNILWKSYVNSIYRENMRESNQAIKTHNTITPNPHFSNGNYTLLKTNWW